MRARTAGRLLTIFVGIGLAGTGAYIERNASIAIHDSGAVLEAETGGIIQEGIGLVMAAGGILPDDESRAQLHGVS